MRENGWGFATTAEEVLAGVDLSGTRILVTGGVSGLGFEAASSLGRAGAEVHVTGREEHHIERAVKRLGEHNVAAHGIQLELTDRDSIDDVARTWSGPLDVVVCSAGVMACPETYTSEGIELQFATNHLGHFRLVTRLHAALAATHGARVVVVSSSGHFRSPVIFDDLNFRYRPYEPWEAYGQSKSANILFMTEASARWADDGIAVNALMPGTVLTPLHRHVGNVLRAPEHLRKTAQQGASTIALLAGSPTVAGVTGRYFVNNQPAEVVERRPVDMTGVAPYVLDRENSARLWSVSEQLFG